MYNEIKQHLDTTLTIMYNNGHMKEPRETANMLISAWLRVNTELPLLERVALNKDYLERYMREYE